MQINSINSYNCCPKGTKSNNSYKQSFNKLIQVSDVILDNKSLAYGKKFNLMIDRAVKFLKRVENQSIDFVKNFWTKADAYDTKNLQRTSNFMVTGQDARALTRASHDIRYKGGDTTEYHAEQKRLINDSLKRLKSNGKEQEIYVKAHSEKGKKIIIDEIGFKDKGGKIPEKAVPAQNPFVDKNGQQYFDFS